MSDVDSHAGNGGGAIEYGSALVAKHTPRNIVAHIAVALGFGNEWN